MAVTTSIYKKSKIILNTPMYNFSNENEFPLLFQTAIIDLRLQEAFSQKHIKGSFNILTSDIESRMHELPESRKPVSIVGSKNSINLVTDFLASKGYSIKFKIDFNEFYRDYKNNLDWFESGEMINRLWQPSSVLQTFLKMNHGLVQPKGIDLACGAGRDSVMMTLNGWQMVAVDYMDSALDRAKNLAKNNQCELETIQLDLEKKELSDDINPFPLEWLGFFDLVIIARYLHRPLLKHLHSLLRPNGFIVYQTFMLGCEKFGSPKNPRYLLRDGELADFFPTYKILHDKVELLSDGRPTNAFIAQKPASL